MTGQALQKQIELMYPGVTLCRTLEPLCQKLPGDLVFAYMDRIIHRWRPCTSFMDSLEEFGREPT